jgi:paraquat-inducible protein A
MSLLSSYAFRHPLHGLVVNLLLILAVALLVVGLQMPILTLEKFYFFSNTVSLLSALKQLAVESEWGLFALVGAFSVVFPILKNLALLIVWNFDAAQGAGHRRHLQWLAVFSKWSMLDVFVVALLVVSVKLGSLAEAHVGMGIYAFAASVILTTLLAAWIGHHGREAADAAGSADSGGK